VFQTIPYGRLCAKRVQHFHVHAINQFLSSFYGLWYDMKHLSQQRIKVIKEWAITFPTKRDGTTSKWPRLAQPPEKNYATQNLYTAFFKVRKSVHHNTIQINQPSRCKRPDHDQQHCYHHAPKVKPEAATAVVELLMMDVRTPETCWAVHKHQVIKLRNCCIYFVVLFELLLKTATGWTT
jgi:hypothetical protein